MNDINPTHPQLRKRPRHRWARRHHGRRPSLAGRRCCAARRGLRKNLFGVDLSSWRARCASTSPVSWRYSRNASRHLRHRVRSVTTCSPVSSKKLVHRSGAEIERGEYEESGGTRSRRRSSAPASGSRGIGVGASCSIPSRTCSPDCRIPASCAADAPPLHLVEAVGVNSIITGERGDREADPGTAWKNTSPTASSCSTTGCRTRSRPAQARWWYWGSTHGTNEYPFLIDHGGDQRSSHHVRRGTRLRANPCRQAFRASTTCSSHGYKAPASRFPVPRDRARPSSDPTSRRRDLHAWRSLPLFRLRGIARPDRAQHALRRPGPAEASRQRPAAVRGRPPHPLRLRDASRAHEPGSRRIQAGHHYHRPDLGLPRLRLRSA